MINTYHADPIKHKLAPANFTSNCLWRINPTGVEEIWNPYYDRWQDFGADSSPEKYYVTWEQTWCDPTDRD